MSRGRRSVSACAALFLLILSGTAIPPGRAADPERLIGAEKLRPFFLALMALEQNRAHRPVRILQIGDSHTANDSFSGRLREQLQGRFGAAGRGWLPAGIPYKYFQPRLVSVSESRWRHLRPSDAGEKPPLGLDAVAAIAAGPDAHMTLTSNDPNGFDRVAIEFIARPHGQPLTIRVDQNSPVRIATAAPKVLVRRSELLLRHPGHQAELAASESPAAEVLGWTVERRGKGVIYENHGSIGATIGLLDKLSPAAVSLELADRKPTLLVVAFGTNEGFRDELNLTDYATHFRAAVAGLAKKARGAAILVIGPPDGNRRPAECSGDAACHADGTADDGGCVWVAPPKLAGVRAIQRRIAIRQGWAFWDWAAAMGGSCAIDKWLRQDPPLAMPDHVHLSKPGYAVAADMLFADLMRAYDTSKGARRR